MMKIIKNSLAGVMGIAVAVSALALTGNITSPAQAQITIGGNEGEFKRELSARGFSRIETQKIGLSNSKFHACKGAKRYEIKFGWTGSIDTKVIGNCRVKIDEARVIKILRDQGYDRINIEDQGGNYVAIACLRGNRQRVKVNHFGDIRGQRKIGKCRTNATPEDISAQLKQKGYSRIKFIDRSRTNYTATACLENDKVELIMNQRGRILEENRVGNCARAFQAKDLIASLEGKGLTRVVITDDKLPRYRAEACRRADRVEIAMNRWGEIRNEVRIGSCRQAYTAADIRKIMVQGGVTNVSVQNSRKGFIVRGCSENRYREFSLNKYAEVLKQKDRGSCVSPAINVLAEKMRSRGMTRLQFFAEGCENGQKVRITFDDFANRTNKENLGQCGPERVGRN